MKLLEADVPADLVSIGRLRKQLRQSLGELRLAASLVNDLQLVFAELATNVVRHGEPKATRIGAKIDILESWIALEISDDGGPFVDFERRRARARRTDLAANSFSGLGLPLAGATLHHLHYEPGSPNRLVGYRPLVRRRPTALILEDDPVLIELYSGCLRPQHRVLTAASAEAALALCAQHAVDIIICALECGDLEGLRLVRGLQQQMSSRPVPLVMLSNDPGMHAHGDFDELDIASVLLRPPTLAALRQAANAALMRTKRRQQGYFWNFGGGRTPKAASQIGTDTHAAAVVNIGQCDPGRSMVLHFTSQDRHRLIVLESLDFGLNGVALCMSMAATLQAVHHLTEGGPDVLLAQLALVMHRQMGSELTVAPVTVVDLLPDGCALLATAGHRSPMVRSERGARSVGPSNAIPGLPVGDGYGVTEVLLAPGETLCVVSESLFPAPSRIMPKAPAWLEAALTEAQHADLRDTAALISERARLAVQPGLAADGSVLLVRARSPTADA